MSWRLCKQYRRLKEYIQDILLLRQPEVYVNTVFYFQNIQVFITWRRTDTQEMCQHILYLYNSPDLGKLVSHHMKTFHTNINSASSFGNSPYVDLFI